MAPPIVRAAGRSDPTVAIVRRVPDPLTTAERFFAALGAFDADAALACCSDGCTFLRGDVGKVESMHEQLGQLLGGLRAAQGTMRYLDPRRVATAEGFVEEHTVEIGLFGQVVSMRTAVIAEVGADGRITAMREYLDPSPLTKLTVPAKAEG
jgi:ketosteroid isomerase-like protein